MDAEQERIEKLAASLGLEVFSPLRDDTQHE